MKKLIVIFISLMLLCGCAAQQQEAVAPTEGTQAPTEEVVVSLYDAHSEVEKQTSGAVRAYPLGDGIHTDLVTMGDKLLIVSAGGDITMLQDEDGQILATEAADVFRNERGLPLWTQEQGAGYYIQETREVVLLDGDLKEIVRVPMPEDILGDPVVLLQRNEVFYCTADQIRAMDIQTGISRLVRSHSCASQTLTDSYFADTVLGCRITDEQGSQKVIYLYSETGEVVAEDPTLGNLYTFNTDYFAMRQDGEQMQILYGAADKETMCLEVDAQGLYPALPMGGAVRCLADETGLELSFYDFATGSLYAQLSLPGMTEPIAMAADSTGYWFIIDQTLYRWDVSKSLTGDQTSYAIQLYTAKNPDTRGLEACQKRVDEIKATYGLELRIWQDALQDNDKYICQPEYRVSVLETALDDLEELLKQMPQDFLATTGNIRVSLVRSLDGDRPVQYWKEGSQDCCIIIPAEQCKEGFLWGLGCGVDTRVLGNSRKLDTWNDLNPKKFAYTYDYALNEAREDWKNYQDDFVDLISMSFPTEDRARVFMAAVLPGNEELFANDTLQEKLIRLCKGIREAYNAEKITDIFPWEQYLEKPIAAKPKN